MRVGFFKTTESRKLHNARPRTEFRLRVNNNTRAVQRRHDFQKDLFIRRENYSC